MTRLADIVGASGLSGYAVVALLLFVFAFLLVLATVFFPSQRSRFDHAAQLPFDDGTTPSSTASEAVR
jgi:cbb3-type cytochrome oxidase subunit 3